MGRCSKAMFVSLLVVFAAGCGEGAVTTLGGGGNGGDGTTASAGGSGGEGTTSSTSSSTMLTMTTSTPTMTTSSTTGGGGDCDPPAPEGSLYALSDIDLDDNVVSMCKFRGDVLLIVNAAEA